MRGHWGTVRNVADLWSEFQRQLLTLFGEVIDLAPGVGLDRDQAAHEVLGQLDQAHKRWKDAVKVHDKQLQATAGDVGGKKKP